MKKIISYLLISVVCLFCLTGCDENKQLTPTDKFFVNDFADVIDSDTEQKIYTMGVALQEKTQAQAVVVTVKSLDGKDIEDYSYDLAKSWALGDKDKDNGILVLLATEDRKVRIEVGSGLEGALPDSKVGRILDRYGVEYFRDDKFSEGLFAVYNNVVNEIYIEYGIEPTSADYTPVDDWQDDTVDDEDIDMLITVVVIAFIIIVILLSIIGSGGPRGGPGRFVGGFYGVGSRGGFGGSGGFRSGGGGGFHGGGGGFSGGGASRGF